MIPLLSNISKQFPQNTQLPAIAFTGKSIDLVDLYNRGTNWWAHDNSSTGREGHEKTDAVLGQGVFRLMQLVDQRLVQTNGTGKCDPKLELSLMYFFQEFRRCYIGEHHGMPTEAEMEEMKMKNVKNQVL